MILRFRVEGVCRGYAVLKHVWLYKILLSTKSTTEVEVVPLNEKSFVIADAQGFSMLETIVEADLEVSKVVYPMAGRE